MCSFDLRNDISLRFDTSRFNLLMVSAKRYRSLLCVYGDVENILATQYLSSQKI